MGLTPVLAWSPPALGAPTSYPVMIWSFDDAGDLFGNAMLETTETSIILPPGVLDAGVKHAATIRAQAGAFDPAAPLRRPAIEAHAEAVTAIFIP